MYHPRLIQFVLALAVCGLANVPLNAKTPTCNNEKWQADIAKFLESDKTDPPMAGAVLFVGSSSIRLWDLKKSFPELTTINRGFGGSEICNSTHYFDQLVAKHRPKVVVLYAGDNDIAGGKSAEQVALDFQAFAKRMKSSLPEAPLLYITIKPSVARWSLAEQMSDANQRIAQQCEKDKQLHFVDLWKPMLNEEGSPTESLFVEDGLHLNAAGYRLWSDVLRKQLAALAAKK